MSYISKTLVFIISAIILYGCSNTGTFLINNLKDYKEKFRVVETKPVPEKLWQVLATDYVKGRFGTLAIEGQTTWKPKRYFGNFQEGSELEELQIVLRPSGSGTFYCNNFFDNMSNTDKDIFKVYYRNDYRVNNITGVVLPNQKTPPKVYMDNKAILQVDNIDYSSKYGGSIEMKFELTDFYDTTKQLIRTCDYGYEFIYNQYTYDIKNLNIYLYLVPKLLDFNPTSNQSVTYNELHVEILPSTITAYKQGVKIDNFYNTDDYTLFNDYLNTLERNLESSLNPSNKFNNVYIFGIAFAHYMHQDLLPPLTEKVTNLYITDNFFDLTSEVYVGLATVSWKINNIHFLGGFYPETDNETTVSYAIHYLTATQNIPITRGTIELYGNDDGPWANVGVFSKQDLDNITGITITLLITEDDPLFDDEYKPITILFNVNDNIVVPKIESMTTGPVGDGLTIFDHEYLSGSGQVWNDPAIYYLMHDLCEIGEDVPDPLNSMNSYLKVTIVKR